MKMKCQNTHYITHLSLEILCEVEDNLLITLFLVVGIYIYGKKNIPYFSCLILLYRLLEIAIITESFLDDLSWPKNNLVNNLLLSKEISLRSLAS